MSHERLARNATLFLVVAPVLAITLVWLFDVLTSTPPQWANYGIAFALGPWPYFVIIGVVHTAYLFLRGTAKPKTLRMESWAICVTTLLILAGQGLQFDVGTGATLQPDTLFGVGTSLGAYVLLCGLPLREARTPNPNSPT